MFRSSSKSYNLEPVYDGKETSSSTSALTKQTGDTLEEDDGVIDYAKLMEPKSVRHRRYFSLGVVCFTAFIFTFSFSIVLTSAKPYLDKMDPEAGTKFLGFFIAAQPLGQLIFSPIMGFLGNKIGSIRILSMISTLILAGGFALYACVSALPEPRRWYLFSARFLIGAASGAITLCYSYVASATTVKERTMAVSLFQLSQASAFVIGPAVQAAFAPLGDGEDHPMGNDLYFNLFTAPSWLSVFLSLLNFCAFFPCVFTEYNMAKEEGDFLAARSNKNKNEPPKKLKKPDVLGLIACIIIFSSVQFNFVFLESLSTLLTIEQLGSDEVHAIVIVGIAFACAGLYNGVIFGAMGFVAKKTGERLILLAGIIFLILGPISLYPYGSELAPFECPRKNETALNKTLFFETDVMPWSVDEIDISFWKVELINGTCDNSTLHYAPSPIDNDLYNNTSCCIEGGGCPIFLQDWCGFIPGLTSVQLVLGFILIVTGYPMGSAMSNAIFSKVIGPHPQGTYMGILQAGACFARVLCPICVTNIYATLGTWATFGFMTGVMVVILIIFVAFYSRLIPYQYEDTAPSVRY